MTSREEEIKEALGNIFDAELWDSLSSYCSYRVEFSAGAKWADRNPQSPWISVKDDLPCNNHNFIHFGFTNRVLVRNKNGDLFVAYMKKNKDNEWIWCNDTDDKFDLLSDITYWMPIPKLPKE